MRIKFEALPAIFVGQREHSRYHICIYIDAAEVQQCAEFLQVRFAAAMTVQRTKQLYAFYPSPDQPTHIMVKRISSEPNARSIKVLKQT